MSEWQELDTSTWDGRRAMNRLLAQRLGYTIWRIQPGSGLWQDHPSYPQERIAQVGTNYKIHAPEGMYSRMNEFDHASEEEAWERVETWLDFTSEFDRVVGVLEYLGVKQWLLKYDSDYGIDHKAGFSFAIDGYNQSNFEETPEIAGCKAILDYLDSRDQHAGS